MNGNPYGQLAALLCAAALFLAGCGGGGGGSGITQDAHDTLQMDYDTAVAELAEARGEVTRLEGELDASQTQAARLRVELTTANGSVTSLTSDLSDANDEVDSLTTQLTASQGEVTRLMNEIGSADDPTSLQGLLAAERARVTNLTSQLETARTEATSLRGQLTTAQNRARTLQTELDDAEAQVTTLQGQVATERTRATQAEQDAEEEIAEAQAEIAQQNQTAEANQRARYLQAAFLLEPPAIGSDIQMNVPSRGRLELTRGTSWRRVTLGGSGLRSTTMALTSTVNTGKTVVYSDRELSRPLLEHFGSLRDPNNLNLLQLTAGTLNFTTVDADGESTDGVVATSVGGATVMDMWKLTHRIPKTVARDLRVNEQGQPVDTNDDVVTDRDDYVYEVNTEREGAKMATSYPLSLFGIGGTLVTAGGGDVTVTPTFEVDPENAARSVLRAVAVSGTGLRFDPSGSPSVHFYNGGDFLGDYEYMVFGYWREDPQSAASPYDSGGIGVFADAMDHSSSLDVPSNFIATYRGKAVGLYVEQEQTDAIDTHRQGEFTANAILRVGTEAGVAAGGDTITGTIRDFVATPTGGSSAPETVGRWVVRLNAQSETNPITLNNQSGATEGDWNHDYVKAHQYAGGSATERVIPPGVTGTFNARIGDIARDADLANRVAGDSLHIIGAFGAHR